VTRSLGSTVVLAALFFVAASLRGTPSSGPEELVPGVPHERSLGAGEVHRYRVAVPADRMLRVVAEQEGADVELRLEGPGGEVLASADAPVGGWGTEHLSWLAPAAQEVTVVVRSLATFGAGTYRLRLEEWRAPGPRDAERLAAERRTGEAYRLYGAQDAASLRQALAAYRDLAPLWHSLNDGEEEARALYMAGHIHRLLGETRESVAALEQALALWRAAGERRREAEALNQKGLALWATADGPGALACYQEALALWEALGDPAAAARTLNNLGLVHRSAGEPRRALEAFERALTLFRTAGDRAREASVLNNRGEIYDLLGEPERAAESYAKALELFRSQGNRAGEAETLNNLGLLNDLVGEPQTALEQYRLALDLFRGQGDRRREAAALYNLAAIYRGLGETERARELLDRSFPLLREVGDRRGEALALSFLSQLQAEAGDPAGARASLEKALKISREIGDRQGEAWALAGLGRLEMRTGAVPAAERDLTAALALRRAIGNRRGEAESLHLLGELRAATGKAGEARDLFASELAIRQAGEDQDGAATALAGLARLDLAAGDLAAARVRLEEALENIESLRVRVARQDLRDTFFAGRQDAYELLIETLLRLHRAEPAAGHQIEALETAERARARGLLDLLREARADLRPGIAPGLAERVQKARRLREAKAGRHARLLAEGAPAAAVEEARGELDAAFEDLAEAEAAAAAASPRYAELSRSEPVRFSELRSHFLDGGTMLLEYALGQDRSWLWAVTPETVEVYELPPREELETAARAAAGSLRRPSGNDPAKTDQAGREALAALARTLLGPVAGRLPERVLVVPDGALHYLPFAALPEPGGTGEPLLAGHEVVHLPSAATLPALRQDRRAADDRGTVAVLADPVFSVDDPRVGRVRAERTAAGPPAAQGERSGGASQHFERLPWTRREAEAILAQAAGKPSLSALDFDADLATATSPALRHYRIVHFATHGVLDSRHPALSGLVLSLVDRDGTPRDGFLRLQDVYGLELDADLVVLSGCETALGREMRGEGLTGLTRGFLSAGTRRVIASLWRVEDRATAELMTRFYHALLAEELRPAEALRAAQLSMWREKRWRDPYFWAAFTIQGDWR
jgi:CHAT domain-containing protein/tetratricopeptide (TPR) repeat protein